MRVLLPQSRSISISRKLGDRPEGLAMVLLATTRLLLEGPLLSKLDHVPGETGEATEKGSGLVCLESASVRMGRKDVRLVSLLEELL